MRRTVGTPTYAATGILMPLEPTVYRPRSLHASPAQLHDDAIGSLLLELGVCHGHEDALPHVCHPQVLEVEALGCVLTLRRQPHLDSHQQLGGGARAQQRGVHAPKASTPKRCKGRGQRRERPGQLMLLTDADLRVACTAKERVACRWKERCCCCCWDSDGNGGGGWCSHLG
jgi:hypothetical protein